MFRLTIIEFIKNVRKAIDKENMYLSMFANVRTDSNFHVRNPIMEVSAAQFHKQSATYYYFFFYFFYLNP